MRGGMALRFAARAYALRGDARGLDAVVAGAQALATDRFKGYRQLDEMIAATVKSVGVRVLEEPGLAELLAGSPFAAVRRALARVLPASESDPRDAGAGRRRKRERGGERQARGGLNASAGSGDPRRA